MCGPGCQPPLPGTQNTQPAPFPKQAKQTMEKGEKGSKTRFKIPRWLPASGGFSFGRGPCWPVCARARVQGGERDWKRMRTGQVTRRSLTLVHQSAADDAHTAFCAKARRLAFSFLWQSALFAPCRPIRIDPILASHMYNSAKPRVFCGKAR